MRKTRTDAATEKYEARQIEGWTVLIKVDLLENQTGLADRALKLLNTQLEQVARAVPPASLEMLRSIRIWVEEDEPHHPCMTYHPNVRWLREHGMNPDKARCVEVANVRNFLKWSVEQKWMVLHELAHGYHHQFVQGGFQNKEVKRAYDHATKERIYETVRHVGGSEQRAYAASNEKEYFAELSEAYFGTNDFYPFVRSELRRHDPRGYDVVEKLWGATPAPAAGKAGGESPNRRRA
jgi:hypothetical protein